MSVGDIPHNLLQLGGEVRPMMAPFYVMVYGEVCPSWCASRFVNAETIWNVALSWLKAAVSLNDQV